MSAHPQSPLVQPQSPSLAELMSRLTEQSTRLARMEVELAKAEMTVKGRRLGIGAGAFGGAGLLGALAVATLTAAIVLLLATAMEDWLAAAVVAAAYLLLGGALALIGRGKVHQGTPPTPEQTMESVRDDVEEAKGRFREGRA